MPKPRTRFTNDDIRAIRWRVKNGESRRELAREYGVTKQTIEKIYWRDTFANVPDNVEDELAGLAELAELESLDPITQNEVDMLAQRLQEKCASGAEQKSEAARDQDFFKIMQRRGKGEG
jgi:transposase-like protein